MIKIWFGNQKHRRESLFNYLFELEFKCHSIHTNKYLLRKRNYKALSGAKYRLCFIYVSSFISQTKTLSHHFGLTLNFLLDLASLLAFFFASQYNLSIFCICLSLFISLSVAVPSAILFLIFPLFECFL
jgi:hypothetical protein